jgi:hypothetical protein
MGYADKNICEKGTTDIGRKGIIDKPLFIETNFWNVDTAFGLIAGKSLTKEFAFFFKNTIKITLKKFLCIFKILFGIGFGLVYGFKSAVKDGNDSFLFG